jgi:hypothetical protein
MKTPATTLAVVLITAVCAGCASIPINTTAPPEALARYKRIGVVSTTTEAFSRVYEGLLSVEREQIDSSSWDIDSKYEQQIATELSSMGEFEAVHGTYSRSEFFRLGYDKSGLNWDALEGPFRNYCGENRVDAILVALAAYSGDFMANTHQRISGAGFIVGFHVPTLSYLHLITIVALVDCQSAKPVATRGLSSLRDGTSSQILRASPVMAAPKEVARTPLKQLTDQQIAAIKNNLVELPRKSWAPTLRAIFGK